jgi:hypothetical protein
MKKQPTISFTRRPAGVPRSAHAARRRWCEGAPHRRDWRRAEPVSPGQVRARRVANKQRRHRRRHQDQRIIRADLDLIGLRTG